jgi:hypothetical protein
MILKRRMIAIALLGGAVFALAPGLVATAAAQSQAPLSHDAREIAQYTMTMDVVNRSLKAVYQIKVALQADPSLDKSNPKSDEDETLDQMVVRMSASPKLVAIAAANGFTPRSFLLAEFCYVQSYVAAMFVKGSGKVPAATDAAQASAANVNFFIAHWAEINALQKKYELADTQ